MTDLYEPVTEIGKFIAKTLKWDDQVRLDIHDFLEQWEPKHLLEKEKAEKWDEEQQLTSREEYEQVLLTKNNLINKHYNKRLEAEKKLKAIKEWGIKYDNWFTMTSMREEFDKILEGEE